MVHNPELQWNSDQIRPLNISQKCDKITKVQTYAHYWAHAIKNEILYFFFYIYIKSLVNVDKKNWQMFYSKLPQFYAELLQPTTTQLAFHCTHIYRPHNN